jgi:hypothetical protein
MPVLCLFEVTGVPMRARKFRAAVLLVSPEGYYLAFSAKMDADRHTTAGSHSDWLECLRGLTEGAHESGYHWN